MKIPYWIYHLKVHSPDWNGWRVKLVRVTLHSRECCEVCQDRSRLTWIDAAVRDKFFRWLMRADFGKFDW